MHHGSAARNEQELQLNEPTALKEREFLDKNGLMQRLLSELQGVENTFSGLAALIANGFSDANEREAAQMWIGGLFNASFAVLEERVQTLDLRFQELETITIQEPLPSGMKRQQVTAVVSNINEAMSVLYPGGEELERLSNFVVQAAQVAERIAALREKVENFSRYVSRCTASLRELEEQAQTSSTDQEADPHISERAAHFRHAISETKEKIAEKHASLAHQEDMLRSLLNSYRSGANQVSQPTLNEHALFTKLQAVSRNVLSEKQIITRWVPDLEFIAAMKTKRRRKILRRLAATTLAVGTLGSSAFLWSRHISRLTEASLQHPFLAHILRQDQKERIRDAGVMPGALQTAILKELNPMDSEKASQYLNDGINAPSSQLRAEQRGNNLHLRVDEKVLVGLTERFGEKTSAGLAIGTEKKGTNFSARSKRVATGYEPFLKTSAEVLCAAKYASIIVAFELPEGTPMELTSGAIDLVKGPFIKAGICPQEE